MGGRHGLRGRKLRRREEDVLNESIPIGAEVLVPHLERPRYPAFVGMRGVVEAAQGPWIAVRFAGYADAVWFFERDVWISRRTP